MYFVTIFGGDSSFVISRVLNSRCSNKMGQNQIISKRMAAEASRLSFATSWLCDFEADPHLIQPRLASSSVNRDENTTHLLSFLNEIVRVKRLAQRPACSIDTSNDDGSGYRCSLVARMNGRRDVRMREVPSYFPL